VEPFQLRGVDALDLRGTAFLGGDADGKNVQIAAGLESPSFRVPGFANTEVSNWIVFGLNAQRQESTDTATGDKNYGLVTFRAFLGKAFGWRRSGDVGQTANKLANDILRQAKTYEVAQGFAEKIRTIPVLRRTNAQKLLLNALDQPNAKANWVETVRALSLGEAQAILDQPTLAVYAETSGWYALSKPPEGSRAKNLFTVTLDYWPLAKRDDVFLRLRYETGFERALPNDRKNHLLASVGFRY